MFARSVTLPALILAVGLGGVCLTGCTGEGTSSGQTKAATLPVAEPLFDATWPMQMVEAEARAPFETPQWVTLIGQRDLRASVQATGGAPGLATARMHADSAALFRQAALATGQSYIETYAELKQDHDPLDMAQPMTVAYAMLGQTDKAKAQIEVMKGLPKSPAMPWNAPWAAWAEAGGAWPPDLSGLPVQYGEPTPGGWPDPAPRPSYELPEREPGTNKVNVDDPALLLMLAMYHDAAARKAAGDQADVVAVYGARYQLPVEAAVDARVDLPLEFLVGGDYLHPKDGAFMAACSGAEGAKCVDSFKDSSFTAAVAYAGRGEDGKLDPVKVVDIVSALRKAWKDRQAEAAGIPEGHHPVFADIAIAGLYRNLALVAEIEGNRETSGRLRIQARDVERNEAGAPEGFMALAAWDADNQYTQRGLDIIHQLARRAPSLEVARTAYDQLAVRDQRGKGPGTPGM